eukprot:TRINITY_DN71575_c0_g1_i1.p1 TRINITY_DN71575_c0_g1~~TRINITY_DN71575_c0_g1_i1.p1  ORF type:complete len:368 (-),score=49.12 TRINITY_DN71575_c0_g1_i1:115-1218(-)
MASADDERSQCSSDSVALPVPDFSDDESISDGAEPRLDSGKAVEVASAQVVPLRCEIEVLPADAEVQVQDIYGMIRSLDIPGVTWIGFRTEPFMYDIRKLVVICKVDDQEVVDVDDIADKTKALSSVQNTRLLSAREYGSDPFDICNRLFVSQGQNLDVSTLRCCDANHIKELMHQGYTLIDGFVDQAVIEAASEVVRGSLAAYPEFGSDGVCWRLPEPRNARSDVAVWLTPGQRPSSDAPFAEHIIPAFERLKLDLCEIFALQGIGEHQLAWYPSESSGYKRHTDAMPDDRPGSDQRKVTAILYCNPGWKPEHGGALRVWLPDTLGAGTVDIEPLSGRLLIFLAGCVPHEVQPASKERTAITCWYH